MRVKGRFRSHTTSSDGPFYHNGKVAPTELKGEVEIVGDLTIKGDLNVEGEIYLQGVNIKELFAADTHSHEEEP